MLSQVKDNDWFTGSATYISSLVLPDETDGDSLKTFKTALEVGGNILIMCNYKDDHVCRCTCTFIRKGFTLLCPFFLHRV